METTCRCPDSYSRAFNASNASMCECRTDRMNCQSFFDYVFQSILGLKGYFSLRFYLQPALLNHQFQIIWGSSTWRWVCEVQSEKLQALCHGWSPSQTWQLGPRLSIGLLSSNNGLMVWIDNFVLIPKSTANPSHRHHWTEKTKATKATFVWGVWSIIKVRNDVAARTDRLIGAKNMAVTNLFQMPQAVRDAILECVSRYGWEGL